MQLRYGRRRELETREILEQVRSGEMSVNDAESFFRRQPFEELGYARLDTHRKVRSGFAEVVFCSGKADEHLLRIYERIYEMEGEVLGTRAAKEQAHLIQERFGEAEYDPLSRILKIEKKGKKKNWEDCGLHGWNSRYPGGGRGGADGGVFWK